jgi:hypothetical protein
VPSGHKPVRYGQPQDRAPVSNRGLVVPVDGRQMISTGVGITVVNGMLARTSRQLMFVEAVTGSRLVFHPAGC